MEISGVVHFGTVLPRSYSSGFSASAPLGYMRWAELIWAVVIAVACPTEANCDRARRLAKLKRMRSHCAGPHVATTKGAGTALYERSEVRPSRGHGCLAWAAWQMSWPVEKHRSSHIRAILTIACFDCRWRLFPSDTSSSNSTRLSILGCPSASRPLRTMHRLGSNAACRFIQPHWAHVGKGFPVMGDICDRSC